jgi:uncharacterized protein YndB with AHSA1/START domain
MSEALAIEAVRKSVTVACAVEEAFRVFTADATSWWPTTTHSIHGDEVNEVVFEAREGGELYEVSAGGERGHWATVVACDPPSRLVLAWNILGAEPVPTEVEVRFTPVGGARTRVESRAPRLGRAPRKCRGEALELRHRLGRRARRVRRSSVTPRV